ncbi:MAG: sporulation protein YqfD [Selenomonadales bacterium]|nr:sporulation protein YqfD [Selenomonadales bacterium]
MNRLTNYCTGFLLLRLTGQNRAAFLSECARAGIPLWSVRQQGGHVLLYSSVPGFLSMRKPARKYRCQIEVLSRRGVPFLLQKARRRLFFSLGAIFFAGLLWLLTSMVWRVEVEGSQKVAAADILPVVREAGLDIGTWRREVDSERIATAILREFPELAWAGVRLKGSVAIIQLVDRAVIPPILRLPGDVVAARAGVITRIIAFSGEVRAAAGDTVARGQLLLSGATAQGGHASGLVEARVWYEAVGSMETTQVVRNTTGRVAVREYVRLGEREVQVAGPSQLPFALYEATTLKRNLLPGVEHVTVTFHEVTRSHRSLSASEAEAAATLAAQEKLRVSLPSGVTILDSRTDVWWSEDKTVVYVRVIAETLEDIAQFVPQQQ